MFMCVDNDPVIEGYSYANLDGHTEFVVVHSATVEIKDAQDGCTLIFYSDIPKLIKALQLAYALKESI